MGELKFRLAPVKAKKITNISTIIDKNVEGIVVKINNEFKVSCKDKLYNITEDSYNCKGKKIVYLQTKKGYTKIIRDFNSNFNCPKSYLPFREGLIVKCNILRIKFKDYAKILVAYNKASSDEFEEAIKMLNIENGNI